MSWHRLAFASEKGCPGADVEEQLIAGADPMRTGLGIRIQDQNE